VRNAFGEPAGNFDFRSRREKGIVIPMNPVKLLLATAVWIGASWGGAALAQSTIKKKSMWASPKWIW